MMLKMFVKEKYVLNWCAMTVFLVVALVDGFVFAASDCTATFSWTPNTETNLAGYKIYYGFSHNGPYNQFKDIGNPEINNGYIIASISGLNDSEVYYFVATAYDNQGNESNYSDETIWTCPNSQTPGEIVLVPTGEMTLVGVDSEETTGEDGRGINAIDGDPATIWHTEWSAATPSHPHEIVIDLGYGRQICGFNYLPRQDGYYNGSIGQYEFFVSMDPNNWGGSVASGTWSATSEKQEISFDAKTARYVKLAALSEVAGNPWTSAAEVEVMEHLGQGENVGPTINSFTGVPSSLNNPGETITFNVSATDPDGDSLAYTINFGDGTANGSGSQVVHTYEAEGTYTAEVSVDDGNGHIAGDSLQVTVDDIPPAEPTNVQAKD